MKFVKSKIAMLISGAIFAISASAVPAEITFTNNTSLALNTSIAGLPGNGISANETRSVGYGIVSMGCNFGNALTNCPIEFTDRNTGDRVATVYMNATTGALVSAPVFYGNYEKEYEVIGWEANPIEHITISAKA